MTQTQQPGDEIYVTAQRWLAAEPDADVRGELVVLMAGDPSRWSQNWKRPEPSANWQKRVGSRNERSSIVRGTPKNRA